MQVTLTDRAEELLKEQLERALEALPYADFLDQRRQRTIDDLLDFARKHKANSGRGNRSWREVIHEGHKY
jgi:hypothetical protein